MWGGFGWIFPLVGLLFMIVMVLLCFRMLRGMSRMGCMPGQGRPASGEIEDLRREVRELKEEVRRVRERTSAGGS
jgi:hypothetical protein